jgi:putative peptidoglycan lipid II flippase
MGTLVGGGWWLWSRVVPVTKLMDCLGLLTMIGSGVAVYAGLLWALKIEGRDDLTAVVTRMRARFA